MPLTEQPEVVKAVYAAMQRATNHQLIELQDNLIDAPVHCLIGYVHYYGIDGKEHRLDYPPIQFTEADILKHFGAGAHYDTWPYADHNGQPTHQSQYIKHDLEWLDRQPESTLLAFADALCDYTHNS